MYSTIIPFGERLEGYNQKLLKYSEMSTSERNFLCGMIRQKRPHKIVEIGVSAGATTAVILNCLKTLSISCEMYSVDWGEKWYKNESFETGFVTKKYMTFDPSVKHKFMLGRSIPYVIDEIGKDIDFLILDTTHCLPGEILDFLVCLPYLKDKALVILHDISLNHTSCDAYAIANKALFCTVKARKWCIRKDDGYVFCLPNIAAFEVCDETRKNVADVFMILSMTWQYLLPEEELEKYDTIIEKHYDKGMFEWIKKIEEVQNYSFWGRLVEQHIKLDQESLEEMWMHQKGVILYGAGYWGNIYLKYAKSHNLPVRCFVISDGEKRVDDHISGIPVYFWSELPVEPNSGMIIIAMDRSKWNVVAKKLIQAGWYTII